MKKMLLLSLFILPVLCFGQKTTDNGTEKEIRRAPNRSPILLQSKAYADSLDTSIIANSVKPQKWKAILVDNEPVYDLEQIKVEDIASISVMVDSADSHPLGNIPRERKTLVIYTKQFVEKNKEEYEAIVLDPGFESFLLTQPSKEFYSETYLKTKNVLMVTEWNARHSLPLLYDPNIYEVSIDYNPQTDYGLEVEYRLYMFFRFMEKEHRMSLIDDGRLTR